MKVKFLILGGGPAGLTLAAKLKSHGINDFLLLEKEKECGGLCRSVNFDGGPLDIGGGHILDVRRKNVLDFVFSYMPQEEWNLFHRNTKIRIGKYLVGYPLESNIWQFPEEEQIDYLESIANAGSVQKQPTPTVFSQWIRWKLGDKIADSYMLPYNSKIFSCNLDDLGTYWLYKLPDVSFREILTSCLRHEQFGTLPGHADFYYPKKFGYGEVFLRIAESIDDKILTQTPVNSLSWESSTVNGDLQAEYIINTVPWREFGSSLPEKVQTLISELRYTSVDIDYYSKPNNTDSHWTYLADPELSYHRILHRENFALGTRGFWTETNSARAAEPGDYHYRNQYAYPLNTIGKPEVIEEIHKWGNAHKIIGLGRWGEWEHMNSDVAIDKAMALAEKISKF